MAVPGTCDPAAVLRTSRPHLAELCLRPTLLLKIPDVWEGGGRPGVFEHLDRTYDQLVDSAAGTGAIRLYDVRCMPRMAGQTLRGGGFGVPKDTSEDRWILPLEETNALVDIDALPGVLYPYLPQLGSLVIKPGQRPVVSKRDARNYHPTLRAGEEWWQWFPHPPLRRDGGGCASAHDMAYGFQWLVRHCPGGHRCFL